MAGKALSPAEVEYIKNHFPEKTRAAIAKDLKRAKTTVGNVIKKYGLDVVPREVEEQKAKAGEPYDTLMRLKAVRDRLYRAMEVATPRELPSLAREYRATVEAVEKMEGAETDDAQSGLDALAASIARRMPA